MVDSYLEPKFEMNGVSILCDVDKNIDENLMNHGNHIVGTIASELDGVLPGVEVKFVQILLKRGKTETESDHKEI